MRSIKLVVVANVIDQLALHTYLKKIHAHLSCRLIFCFRCSPEGLMEIATSTRSLAYYYQLVLENKNWMDAQRYCEDAYNASLVVIDNLVDHKALKQYLDPLLGQLACA